MNRQTKRTRLEAAHDKRIALEKADAAGEVADSSNARLKLMERVYRGEITVAECQAELAAIKRNAKKNGKLTRSQVWSRA